MGKRNKNRSKAASATLHSPTTPPATEKKTGANKNPKELPDSKQVFTKAANTSSPEMVLEAPSDSPTQSKLEQTSTVPSSDTSNTSSPTKTKSARGVVRAGGAAALDEEVEDDPLTHCSHIVKCDAHLTTDGLVSASQRACHQCQFIGKSRWLCLAAGCGAVLCNQATAKHMDDHSQARGHPVQVNLTTWRLWCAICQHELVLDRNRPRWPPGEGLFSADGKRVLKGAAHSRATNSTTGVDDVGGRSNRPRSANSTSASDERDRLIPSSPDSGTYSHDSSVVPSVHKRPPASNSASYRPMIEATEASVRPDSKAHASVNVGRDYREPEAPVAVVDPMDEDKVDFANPRGLTGLQNLGNTCYMNAAVQALSNCAPFAEYYLSTESLPNTQRFAQNQARVSLIFQRLLTAIWDRERRGCVAPRLLLNAFAQTNPLFRGYQQQDSQEFLRCFLDLLHQETKQPLYSWEKRARSNTYKYDDDYCADDGGEHDSNTASVGGSSRQLPTGAQRSPTPAADVASNGGGSSSSEDADSFETADGDSGCSSDSGAPQTTSTAGDGAGGGASLRYRTRQRHRSSSPYAEARGDLRPTSTASTSSSGVRRSPPSPRVLASKAHTSAVAAQSWPNLLAVTSSDGVDDNEDGSVGGRQEGTTTSRDEDATTPRRARFFRSIVSDVFDGRLLSSVRCLTCGSISRTKENFQDLSLPIPSGEQLDRLRQQTTGAGTPTGGGTAPDGGGACGSAPRGVDDGGWLRWLAYGWVWSLGAYLQSPSISLRDCLEAFFAPDELRGDDMYNCEKCGKLRNGQKVCKVLSLPEVLCIHLKRFRHDTAHSTKVSTTVTFPMDELDFSPFLHHQGISKVTSYELVAVVTHYGGVDGGHYVAYARNRINGLWYEFDDSIVSKVDPAEVLGKEAYVLFYQKKTNRTERIREDIQHLLNRRRPASVLKYYISSEWLHRFNTFAEPGAITNYDFLCPHGLIKPTVAHCLADYYAEVPGDLWTAFRNEFGGGPPCHKLQYCLQCQHRYARLQIKRTGELAAFKKLQCDESVCDPRDRRVISRTWFAGWERFVLGVDVDPPGAVDNSALLLTTNGGNGPRRLRPTANYNLISKHMWDFFVASYGGAAGELYHTYGVQPEVTTSPSASGAAAAALRVRSESDA